MRFTRLIFCTLFIYQFYIHEYVFELPQCTHGTISNKCLSVEEMLISRVDEQLAQSSGKITWREKPQNKKSWKIFFRSKYL